MANRKRRTTGSRSRPAPSSRRPPGPPGPRGPAQRKTPVQPAVRESALRTWVAKHSRGVVVGLSGLPQFVVPGAMIVLMLVGLVAPVPVAVVALAVIVVFICWLAFLSWPVLAAPQRGMRVLAIALIAGAAVARLAGWL